MAVLWDILGKAANLAQLFGLDAITIITMVMTLLQFYENKRQCWKLEGRLQVLRALLQRPTSCLAVIQHSEMGDSVRKELKDVDDLVESYKKSTLWSRLCMGRSTASQFRDMRNVIDSHCSLILFINANLLIQANPCRPDSRILPINDGSGGVPAATGSSAGAEVSSIVPAIQSQEGIDSDTGTTGQFDQDVKSSLPTVDDLV